MFVVQDRGTGMSSRALQHAFDPFFSERPAGRGTGLGLTRVRRLVEIHGGDVAIQSKQGLGTTVTISLDDNSQNGTGHCTITAEDGATVYADVTCSGFHLVGCNGDFKLTGGTGRFAGITGGGPIIIRSEFAKIAAAPENTAQEEARGIMYLKALHYTIP